MKTKNFLLTFLALVIILLGFYLWKCYQNGTCHDKGIYNGLKLGKYIDQGEGIIYDSLRSICDTDSIFDYGYILYKDPNKDTIMGDSIILFINNNDVDLPQFYFDTTEAPLIRFDIYELKSKYINMTVAINANYTGEIVPVNYCDITRYNPNFRGHKNHDNGNIHDPKPPQELTFDYQSNSFETGFLLGKGHLIRCTDFNLCGEQTKFPRILLYFDKKNQHLQKRQNVCYEQISISILEEKVNVATNLRLNCDGCNCN